MNHLKNILLISCVSLSFATVSNAQHAAATDTAKAHHPAQHVRRQSSATAVIVDKKEASTFFNAENYWAALEAYLQVYKDTPKDFLVNYRIGISYLKTKVGKAKAVPYLEYAAKQKEAPKDAYLNLGKAYHYANRFDDAISSYNTYKELNKLKGDALITVDRLLEMCENAKELVAKPVDATFENLGKSINTPTADYAPYINSSETYMIFSSQRPANTGGSYDNPEDLGQYPSDVYFTTMKDGAWQKAKNIGFNVNTEESEECVGLNAAGDKMILFFDSKNEFSDLYLSLLKTKQWQKPETMGPNINSKSVESGGTLSSNGNTFIFSSDRKGGIGGKDLYKTKRLPNGDWGTPENLGPTINSIFDEDGPFLTPDDKTLYFSSKGFNSMGGYDFFKSDYDAEKDEWSEPINLGYPINTTDDNLYMSITADKKRIYLAQQREDGLGDLDIYKVTLNSEPGGSRHLFMVQGNVNADSATDGRVKITLKDTSGKTIGIYNTKATGGKFIMFIPIGKYHLTADSKGYKPYSDDFTITDKMQPADLQKSILLSR